MNWVNITVPKLCWIFQREQLPFSCGNNDDEEKLDDQPAIVVLKPGDLTAEEVELEKKKEEIGI